MKELFLFCAAILATTLIIWFSVELLEPKIRIYRSDYTNEEIKFGEEKVYPKANTQENSLKTYFEAVRNKDKLTVKLLSTPSFATISPELWEEVFDKFWQKYQGTPMSFSKVKFNEKLGCNAVLVSFKNENLQSQFVCVNKNSYEKSTGLLSSETLEYYTFNLLQ